ncbi:MAG: hypothetical protein ACFWUD_01700 [Thermocaproicibacter melissae]|jgi:hypothetical protein|uniref:hypothetical protein n=1 Tax=Thermocaproicibacter melissae TaxID=2966552 RepID=UPI0024B12420|nr:hypothetical protein [Thermocaproicibacter melissae]WBY63563.1 hypothetical protein NOG13_06205 [Thermocaproicibacter melissae]
MDDEKLAVILFDIGFVMTLASMVIGPFGITNWAIMLAGIACCLALGAMAIAFEGWDVPPEDVQVPEPTEEQDTNNRQDVSRQ